MLATPRETARDKKIPCILLITLGFVAITCVSFAFSEQKMTGVKEPRIQGRLCTNSLEADDVVLQQFTKELVTDADSVFFVETTGSDRILPRAACSIESASLAMNRQNVFVLMTNNSLSVSERHTRTLLDFHNIHFKQVIPEDILKYVGLSEWYSKQLPQYRPYVYAHLSDALRASLLYLHGGIYLDTDVIVQKYLGTLQDSVGLESDNDVNVAVMKFRPEHPFLKLWLESISIRFNPSGWGSAGPFLVTSLLLEACNIQSVNLLLRNEQGTLCSPEIPKVLPQSHFYLVPYTEHYKFFMPEFANETARLVRDSYTVHIWNKMNSDLTVLPNVTSAFNILAQKYCPSVYSATGGLF